MTTPTDAGGPGPQKKRARAHPSAGSKLGAKVYPRASKYPQITGAPTGRPKTPEVLKGAFLGCLRYGLSESTARAIVGVSDTVVARWKAEVPEDESAIPFAVLVEQAKSTPKLNVSRALVQRAEKGDTSAAMFFLKTRTREYSDKAGPVPVDIAKQIRAFVSAAMVCQTGTPDPAVIETFDDPVDDDDATVGG